VNAAILDGMRRYDLFRGDDPPGPFAYILAAPASLRVALQGPEREQWRAALLQEFEALDESLTWRLLHKSLTPKEAVLLPSMVVLTKKRKKDELGVEHDDQELHHADLQGQQGRHQRRLLQAAQGRQDHADPQAQAQQVLRAAPLRGRTRGGWPGR
jgi:hypothetical protein